jgi:hypothetical protein
MRYLQARVSDILYNKVKVAAATKGCAMKDFLISALLKEIEVFEYSYSTCKTDSLSGTDKPNSN